MMVSNNACHAVKACAPRGMRRRSSAVALTPLAINAYTRMRASPWPFVVCRVHGRRTPSAHSDGVLTIIWESVEGRVIRGGQGQDG
jgi:hypothetical protein